jgi:hypothetical protein
MARWALCGGWPLSGGYFLPPDTVVDSAKWFGPDNRPLPEWLPIDAKALDQEAWEILKGQYTGVEQRPRLKYGPGVVP